MKTLLLLLTAISLHVSAKQNDLYPNHSYSTLNLEQATFIELIVSFENLSPKQYEELDLILSNLNGFRNNGHCERMNVFYLSYDASVYHSADEAFNALVLKTKNYQPLMKIGATAIDVQRECNK